MVSQFFQLDRLVVEGGKTVRIPEGSFGITTDNLPRESNQGRGMILSGKRIQGEFQHPLSFHWTRALTNASTDGIET